MRRIGFAFLYIFLIISACSKGQGENDGGNKDNDTTGSYIIKIMSYNIRHGAPVNQDNEDIHLDGIAAAINRQKPDLVALQEVDSVTTRAPYKQAEKLGELTGMYSFFARTINYQGGGYGIAILSKYPIDSAYKYEFPMPDPSGEKRAVAMIKVTIDNVGELYFASSHLDLKEQNRVAQVNKLIALENKNNAPFIIAGDFNATPDAPEIQKLQQHYIASCTSNCPKTFPSDNPVKTIDYILLNRDAAALFQTEIYKVMSGVLASDHLPLIAHLELKE